MGAEELTQKAMGRIRVQAARSMIRFGRLVQSLAIAVMRPKDLIEFTRLAYAPARKVAFWGQPDLVDEGLYPNEEALLARTPIRRGRLLVLGIGGGREGVVLAQRGYDVTGVDFVPEMVETARRNAADRGVVLTGIVQEISRLQTPPGAYDVVWFSARQYSCVPTRTRRVDLLRKLAQTLSPGGSAVCQFYWDKPEDIPSRAPRIFKFLGWATLGYRQFETGDVLWQNSEFLHAFSDEPLLRREFEDGGFSVTHFELFPAYKSGGAVLQKR